MAYTSAGHAIFNATFNFISINVPSILLIIIVNFKILKYNHLRLTNYLSCFAQLGFSAPKQHKWGPNTIYPESTCHRGGAAAP